MKLDLLSREFGVGLGRGASEGNQSSVSSARGSQKRKALVRKESADTQEYESCQLNDVDRLKSVCVMFASDLEPKKSQHECP